MPKRKKSFGNLKQNKNVGVVKANKDIEEIFAKYNVNMAILSYAYNIPMPKMKNKVIQAYSHYGVFAVINMIKVALPYIRKEKGIQRKVVFDNATMRLVMLDILTKKMIFNPKGIPIRIVRDGNKFVGTSDKSYSVVKPMGNFNPTHVIVKGKEMLYEVVKKANSVSDVIPKYKEAYNKLRSLAKYRLMKQYRHKTDIEANLFRILWLDSSDHLNEAKEFFKSDKHLLSIYENIQQDKQILKALCKYEVVDNKPKFSIREDQFELIFHHINHRILYFVKEFRRDVRNECRFMDNKPCELLPSEAKLLKDYKSNLTVSFDEFSNALPTAVFNMNPQINIDKEVARSNMAYNYHEDMRFKMLELKPNGFKPYYPMDLTKVSIPKHIDNSEKSIVVDERNPITHIDSDGKKWILDIRNSINRPKMDEVSFLYDEIEAFNPSDKLGFSLRDQIEEGSKNYYALVSYPMYLRARDYLNKLDDDSKFLRLFGRSNKANKALGVECCLCLNPDQIASKPKFECRELEIITHEVDKRNYITQDVFYAKFPITVQKLRKMYHIKTNLPLILFGSDIEIASRRLNYEELSVSDREISPLDQPSRYFELNIEKSSHNFDFSYGKIYAERKKIEYLTKLLEKEGRKEEKDVDMEAYIKAELRERESELTKVKNTIKGTRHYIPKLHVFDQNVKFQIDDYIRSMNQFYNTLNSVKNKSFSDKGSHLTGKSYIDMELKDKMSKFMKKWNYAFHFAKELWEKAKFDIGSKPYRSHSSHNYRQIIVYGLMNYFNNLPMVLEGKALTFFNKVSEMVHLCNYTYVSEEGFELIDEVLEQFSLMGYVSKSWTFKQIRTIQIKKLTLMESSLNFIQDLGHIQYSIVGIPKAIEGLCVDIDRKVEVLVNELNEYKNEILKAKSESVIDEMNKKVKTMNNEIGSLLATKQNWLKEKEWKDKKDSKGEILYNKQGKALKEGMNPNTTYLFVNVWQKHKDTFYKVIKSILKPTPKPKKPSGYPTTTIYKKGRIWVKDTWLSEDELKTTEYYEEKDIRRNVISNPSVLKRLKVIAPQIHKTIVNSVEIKDVFACRIMNQITKDLQSVVLGYNEDIVRAIDPNIAFAIPYLIKFIKDGKWNILSKLKDEMISLNKLFAYENDLVWLMDAIHEKVVRYKAIYNNTLAILQKAYYNVMGCYYQSAKVVGKGKTDDRYQSNLYSGEYNLVNTFNPITKMPYKLVKTSIFE